MPGPQPGRAPHFFALAEPPRRLFCVERCAGWRFAALLDERFAALAATPRDLGRPSRSSLSPAGELLRRERVLLADPLAVSVVAPRVATLPLARLAPVLRELDFRAIENLRAAGCKINARSTP